MQQLEKPLIIHWPFGPTFKDRIIANIKNFPAYKFFDVLIITDDISYFSDILSDTICAIDVNEYRKNYEDSFKYEILPKEKIHQTKYKNEIHDLMSKGIRFPCNIQRFALLYEKIQNYKYIMICDCDMIPTHTEDDFKKMMEYLKNDMPENSITSNRAYYQWNNAEYLNRLNKYNILLNKNIEVSYPIHAFDSLFKIFKFQNFEKIKEFFNVWNYIVLDSFKENDHTLIGGSWNILPEGILALTYKLCNITVNNKPIDYMGVKNVSSFTYPEDRFWGNVMSSNLYKETETREEYIKVNYELLLPKYQNELDSGFKNEFFKF